MDDPDGVGTFPADDFAAIFFGFPFLLFATAMPSRARGILLYVGLPVSAALLLWLLHACVKRRRPQVKARGETERKATGKHPRSQEVTKEILVPTTYAGYVIGRGGSTIKKFQEDYSVRIHFKEDKDEQGNHTVIIIGGAENVDRAEAAIKQLVHQKQNQPEPVKLVIQIPVEYIGRIIGKQGTTIRQVQHESGAKVNIDRSLSVTIGNKDVTIIGQPGQVDHACQLLKELLEGLSPRATPSPRAAAPHPKRQDSPLKRTLLPGQLPPQCRSEPFPVRLSAVEEEGCLWLQVQSESLSQLDLLLEEMATFYETHGAPLQEPLEGDYCAAKFECDDSWYRSQLTELNLDGKWGVLFVDYGDIGSSEPDKIMKLRSGYCGLPCQAIKCRLSGIQYNESTLSTECLEMIDSLVLCEEDRELKMIVVAEEDHKPPLVAIKFIDDGREIDLAERLIERGFLKPTEPEEENKTETEKEDDEDVKEEDDDGKVEEKESDGNETEEEDDQNVKEDADDDENVQENPIEKGVSEEIQQESLSFSSPLGKEEEAEEIDSSFVDPGQETVTEKKKRNRSLEVYASSEDELDKDVAEEKDEDEEFSLQDSSSVVVQSQYFIRDTETAAVVLEWSDSCAEEVKLEGTFTNGQQVPLSRDPENGTYSATFHLSPGRHVFSYLVDGVRTHRPDLPTTQATEPSDFRYNYVTVQRLLGEE